MAGAPTHVLPRRLTRRAALAAAAAGTLALAAGPARAAAAAVRPAGGLDPRRAAAYRRLVRVLHGAPDTRFAHRPPTAASAAFAEWYAAQVPEVREHADAVLDRLAAAPDLSCASLLASAPPQEAAVLAAAVALAAVACDPPPGEDERPALPALGVPPLGMTPLGMTPLGAPA